MHKTIQALGKMFKSGDLKSAKVKDKVKLKAPKKSVNK
jgi:hypothetical protein